MRVTTKYVLFILLISFFYSCKKVEKSKPENWTPLFNGKDLTGWTAKINGYELGNNYNNTFRVENGALIVSYDSYDSFTNEFGHLFYETPFSNYKLRLEYRFVGEQVEGGESWAKKNSGIMIHCQSPESMLINQGFPISLEVQLLGGINENEPRPSGNLCTPGTHVIMNNELITEHCIQADCKTYYDEEWITVEVIVNNDSITHFIDGKSVISYSKPTIGGEFLDSTSEEVQAKEGQPLTGGYISLQSESHPIEFRNIEILELK
ncbi:3-keto-disaccharide hydrolase [Flaviramulus multivorans]|uniref:3-keto-disaccharide hydrolase n=1 Tax=Flaviramulus multivorans TaxID=1304750 RepID=UPI0036D2BC09